MRGLYPHRVWKKNTKGEKILYLTFDDGPHESATLFALEQLKQFNAKATFFCIGKNVAAYPDIYQKILNEGHSVGNHTCNHLNGWKTETDIYLDNIHEAQKLIASNLFRPPYGRMKKEQERLLLHENPQCQIVMWDVLSGDFDINISGKKCLRNILRNAESGSIIVFHDSQKAFERMKFALPETLSYFSEKGFLFQPL